MKKIVLSGGGTAGHVTPNLALVPLLKDRGYEIVYIGSKTGIEKDLVEKAGIKYYGISSGKLRRYFSLKNFTDPFRVINGYFEAKKILKNEKPDIVFSKGGFVTVPVVRAAGSRKIPVITHESDMTPGLANKLNLRVATKICCNFPETAQYLPADKVVVSGCPIRQELLAGDKKEGLSFCGFDGAKPVLMIIGGSIGSVHVNEAMRAVLDRILPTFDVVHICGKGNLATDLADVPGYKQFEYVSEELGDVFAAADIVVSRAGANAICELLALAKPMLLIPLPAASSRGDQILNADSFAAQGFAEVLREENITDDVLIEKIMAVYNDRDKYTDTMKNSPIGNAAKLIAELIDEVAGD